jgi:hypothetical protein
MSDISGNEKSILITVIFYTRETKILKRAKTKRQKKTFCDKKQVTSQNPGEVQVIIIRNIKHFTF